MKTFSKVSDLALQYGLAQARQHDARTCSTQIVNLITVFAQTRKTFAGHMPPTIASNVAAEAERPVLPVRGGPA
jgi:hypothetical protein